MLLRIGGQLHAGCCIRVNYRVLYCFWCSHKCYFASLTIYPFSVATMPQSGIENFPMACDVRLLQLLSPLPANSPRREQFVCSFCMTYDIVAQVHFLHHLLLQTLLPSTNSSRHYANTTQLYLSRTSSTVTELPFVKALESPLLDSHSHQPSSHFSSCPTSSTPNPHNATQYFSGQHRERLRTRSLLFP
jgi:hypothetical protein